MILEGAGVWGGAHVPVGAPGFVCPLQGDTLRGTGELWELSLEGLGPAGVLYSPKEGERSSREEHLTVWLVSQGVLCLPFQRAGIRVALPAG